MSTEIVCPTCGYLTKISTRKRKDRGRYCRRCGTKIADAVNPTFITKEKIRDSCNLILEIVNIGTVEGEELFNKLNHKQQLRPAQVMSLVGGLMARHEINSPRVGIFTRTRDITKVNNLRSCLRENCKKFGEAFCEISTMDPDRRCPYIRGADVIITEWIIE